jgi:flagellar assembly protein FliH
MSRDRIRNVPPPASGAKAASYARFIPREELSSFSAWSPGALTGATSPHNSGLRRAADR